VQNEEKLIMRCKEVIRRLNEGLPLNSEMQQHLASCPSCAREVRAAGMIVSAFDSVQIDANEDPTPIDHVRETVMAKIGKEKSIVSRFEDRIRSRPRMAFAAAIAAALLIVVTLVPFSYEKTVGYDAAFAGIDPDRAVPVSKLQEASAALGYDAATINMSVVDDAVTYRIGNLPTKLAVRELRAALATTVGFSGEPAVTEIKEKVSGTLYAQAWDQLIEIEVDATGKTDEEIEAEIEAKLLEYGATSADVSVSTSGDGERQISVDLSGDDSATWNIGVFDGGDDAGLTGINIDGADSLSDAEVKALIEEQLRARGIADPDVSVETGSDGMRRISIGQE
jgi:hypothetical protein